MATRQRIVAAAMPLFVRDGYVETTMAGIARAAGVAVQTLYLSFGSKAAVLEAALASVSDDQPNEWLAHVRAEPDGPAALRRYVDQAAQQVERRFPLDAALRAAAADPEPAELLERSRQAELAVHAQAVDELAEKPGFTTRISLQRATEIVATVLSHETYGLLVGTHGWPAQDWTDWVTRHLEADLFPE
ncbi:MAG TPA: TetR/AcrR family transcriptional regulator [Pseudonocardia sp.]|jgi:AcrR family transcriptional regulator|uniref:TetR/AcrR family transcriptional regulator n=1 Tax=Pseudonocardia sp. TaxID=60912 RepID=UPI002B4B70EF|nr:TetR/AcrR family transcriptional regulator [Pseudonocardia sp.]HLU57821.1 TetR/AcrR family transcriptional regulator [Pseudonocardia sp.]